MVFDESSLRDELRAAEERIESTVQAVGEQNVASMQARLKEIDAQIEEKKARGYELSKKLPNWNRILIGLVFAIVLDLFDWVGFLPPLLGDFVDILGTALMMVFTGMWALVGLFEIIPQQVMKGGFDILPFFILSVVLYYVVTELRHSSERKQLDAIQKELKELVTAAKEIEKGMSIEPQKRKDYALPKFHRLGMDFTSSFSIGVGKIHFGVLFAVIAFIFFFGPTILGFLLAQNPADYAFAAQNSVLGGANVIVDAVNSYIDRINLNIAKASGEYQKGEVDPSQQSFAGIEFQPPLLPNPRRAQQGEPLEISTRIHGFNNEPFDVELSCYAGTITDFPLGSGYKELPLSKQQEIVPSQIIQEESFIEEVTCYTTPKIQKEKDTWITYIEAEAQNLRTDSRLTNNFIKEDQLKALLKSYSLETGITLDQDADVRNAMLSLFEGLPRESVSLSDPGPLLLIISTNPLPLVGVEQGDRLRVALALENTLDGRITDIQGVALAIPPGFSPSTTGCSAWEESNGFLILKPEEIDKKRATFPEIKRAMQLQLPSCTLEVSDIGAVLSQGYAVPNPKTFVATVQFNYEIQEEHRTTITCKECSFEETTQNAQNLEAGDFLSCKKVTPQSSLTPEQAKAVVLSIASELKIPQQVALNLVQAESSFRHTNPDGSVRTNQNPTSCDYGYMQINAKAHPACFDVSARRTGSICDVKECIGKTVIEPECNIAAGLNLLRMNYDRYKDGIPESALRSAGCTPDKPAYELYLAYRGWDAALRAYNGLSCDPEFVAYVDKVNSAGA
ncbi:hypothetical protein D6774_03545 [Candidatus Woesearchaeota archaeon]|nr:MAG: hypothetical protein D6774_03545 [Candidatus Woesearchaeota archaeon]